ncbi:MAG: globin [Halioglobus sp.]
MTVKGSHILDSLAQWAEVKADPTESVYALLFTRYPDLESLFIMDTDGGVRGSMLQQAFECIMDHLGENQIAASLVSTSRILHDGYGVPAGQFDEFFGVVRDSCRADLAQRWTASMAAEWDEMLDTFKALS